MNRDRELIRKLVPLLPISVRPLSLPSYSQLRVSTEELTAKDAQMEEEFEDEAGEDGLGNVAGEGKGWDVSAEVDVDEETKDWLEDDDIEDF